MTQQRSLRSCGRLLLAATTLIAVVLLPACGGGGEDTSPPTVRPKTLDDLVIQLTDGPSMQFIRSANSPTANLSGETETGTLLYNFNTDDNFVDYLALDGIRTNCYWSSDLINISYEYTAINDNQARLTVYADLGNDEDFLGTPNPNPINGRPQSAFWLIDSAVPPNFISECVFDLSFTGDGSVITLNPVRVIIPGSALPDIDNVEVAGTIRTKDGDLVPENYNPMTSTNLPSDIAQPYLNTLTFNCTNTGLGDPNFDFNITFAATQQWALGAKSNETDPDEIGTFNITIGVGTPSPVLGAGDYTYRRINGTDEAILVLSGTGTTFDGTYTLAYAGRDNGDYIGQVDGGTPDVNEVIGTFLIPGAPDFTNPAPITVP